MKRSSLRNRIIVLSLGLYILAVVIVTVFVTRRDEDFVIRQGEIWRRYLTEILAISITNAMLYEELGFIEEGGLIENTIEEWMGKEDLHVRSIQVINPRGRIVAANDLRLYGKEVDDALSDEVGMYARSVVHHHTGADGKPVLKVATPLNISTRSWGHLRVEYSMRDLIDELRMLSRTHLLVTLFALLISSILIALYIYSQFRPLTELQGLVNRMSGEPWLRTPVRRHDEIGDLSEAFNSMLDQLENLHELERDTQEKFIQEQRISVIGKIAAGVAHEVRNPLAGILNIVENLERYKVDDEKHREYTRNISEGLVRIEKIVDGLVSFARQSRFTPEHSNIITLVKETLKLVEYPMREAQIKILWELPVRVPSIYADADQIRQVLLNILLNAIQAIQSGGGGKLTIGLRCDEGEYLALYIQDDGVGIQADVLPRIFDPFFTTQSVGEGTGLGLAVSQNIIEQHGGRIEVESVEGKWTRFTILLPTAVDRNRIETEERLT